jgi:hypothetical protein
MGPVGRPPSTCSLPRNSVTHKNTDNRDYWDGFHTEDNHYNLYQPNDRSNFAEFCRDRMETKSSILELGSGNCRDLRFFNSEGFIATGSDYSESSREIAQRSGISFILLDYDDPDWAKNVEQYDYVYARFLLHSVLEESLENIVKGCVEIAANGVFFEFRTHRDCENHEFGESHRRSPIDVPKFVSILEKLRLSYSIRHRKGFSIMKNEDPFLARVQIYT